MTPELNPIQSPTSRLPSASEAPRLFLVIGAGPTGLAVAKALGEAGIGHCHVEATDSIGGNWTHGVYDTVHIISSRKTTEYSDFPMPPDWPYFPSAAQMRTYLRSYADTFGLTAKILFETRVTRAEPRPDAHWDVTFEGGAQRTFKGVIVCNGHHWAKVFPDWAWLPHQGPDRKLHPNVLHSKDYKSPEQLRGKRVLVIGGGNSACDIVSEAARVGAAAGMSLRRGYWFMPKMLFGVPTIELMKPYLPVPLQRAIIRAALAVAVGPYERYGLPKPDHQIFDAHPTVGTEVLHYLSHGRITPRPDVARLDGDRVHFVDGQSADYDLIVCATGFDVSFPFLPEGTVPVVGKAPQLYAAMLRPEHRHLWVLGAYQPRYGIGPLLRPMAQLVATWIRLQDELGEPLAQVLMRLGLTPTSSHLVDPNAAKRGMKLGQALVPLMRLVSRRRSATP